MKYEITIYEIDDEYKQQHSRVEVYAQKVNELDLIAVIKAVNNLTDDTAK